MAQVAVCAVLKRRDGRYLVIRRAQSIPGGGYWCPVTGRREPGESLHETVAREVREEVGLDVWVGDEVHQCPTSDGHYMLRWFDCWPIDPQSAFESLALDPREVEDARWLRPEEIASLEPIFEATKTFFAQFKRKSSDE